MTNYFKEFFRVLVRQLNLKNIFIFQNMVNIGRIITCYVNLSIRTTFNRLFSTNLKHTEYIKKFKLDMPKLRENPIIMKLESPEFKSIFTPELESLIKIFNKHGYEIRVAGGAVRDILMEKQPKDLDFATTATPEQMKEMFTAEEIRMINDKGEKHGTITPRINDKENFEVTTLRIDVVTDGRHADVVYTTDWMLDANRRDLTINSMYLGLDGSVYDYFYGYDDLKKKRVAFVGDPDTRIKEDYLRILRYFRFYGRIASRPDNHEDSTLHTISENINGLERISGERIWSELKKILEGNFAGELMKTMLHVGIARYIGLPENPNENEFDIVWKRCQNNKMHPITLLTALLHDTNDAVKLYERLKFSAYERDLAIFITQHRHDEKVDVKPLLPYQKLILSFNKPKDTKEWVQEVLKYRNDTKLLEELEKWEIPKFPLSGKVLMNEYNLKAGRMVGEIIKQLKLHWAENGFGMTTEDLLKAAPKIIEEVENKIKLTKS
ncbi:CCA tRNA nucleotidyltransferase 1, mitochondrial [Chrysoperla carnea]|uniref:CCA tRNA nucleotidyltransferase 1, mitochondrial n=1 Tax=Chrysoperla carnea TaxID=189513 RepID=UPI001D08001A|nr:CCA tRNA nucleotidyltransferase 1, mitochondrial [Chrysoperla carnea]